MILIFGGAYQGKLDFAKKKFGVTDRQVFTCTEGFKADQEAKVLCKTSTLPICWRPAEII